MARNRDAGEHGYKNDLSLLDDVDLSNERNGSMLAMGSSTTVVAGMSITVNNVEPTDQEGEDGDLWFVI